METQKVRAQAGHEAGKLRRRRAIVDAARAIIAEGGDTELTMRGVAARAGVSQVTPYNLFGTKQAILREIYEEDFNRFQTFFEREASESPLLRLFQLAELSFRYWEDDIDFFRSISATLYYRSGPEVTAPTWSPRVDSVHRLVEDAVATGGLVPATPTLTVAQTLMRIFNAAIQEWIGDAVTLDQVREQVAVGFLLVLGSLVTEDAKDQVASIKSRYGLEL